MLVSIKDKVHSSRTRLSLQPAACCTAVFPNLYSDDLLDWLVDRVESLGRSQVAGMLHVATCATVDTAGPLQSASVKQTFDVDGMIRTGNIRGSNLVVEDILHLVPLIE